MADVIELAPNYGLFLGSGEAVALSLLCDVLDYETIAVQICTEYFTGSNVDCTVKVQTALDGKDMPWWRDVGFSGTLSRTQGGTVVLEVPSELAQHIRLHATNGAGTDSYGLRIVVFRKRKV